MKKLFLLILIFVVIAVVSVKRIQKKDSAARNFSQTPMAVYSYRIKTGNIVNEIDFMGNLVSESRVNVSSQITQKVLKVYKDENTKVKKGDLLVKLDDTAIKQKILSLKSKLKSLELAIKSKESNLGSANENYNYWSKELDRNKQLLQKNAIAQEVYDKSLTSFQKSKSDLNSLKINISKLKSDLLGLKSILKETEVLLSYTEIKSSVDGIVSEKKVEDGDLAPVGKTLLVIDSTGQYKIVFNFSQEDSNKIKKGNKVIVKCPDLKETNVFKITKIYPSVSKNQSVTAEILLDKIPHKNILIGRYLPINVIIKEKNGVLLVPENNVIQKNNKYYVYTVRDEKLHLKEIKVGISDGEKYEVISGLTENEIIASGSFLELSKFFDGQKVKVVNK